MSDPIGAAVLRVLAGMKGYPPEPLLDEVNHRLRRDGQSLTEDELLEVVTTGDPNDPVRMQFHFRLSEWDRVTGEPWTARADGTSTGPSTADRRDHVVGLLGLGEDAGLRIAEMFPVRDGGIVVISETPADWTPWYTPERAVERTFYWDAYRGVLARRLDGNAISELDHATSEVVRRLADPTRPEPYQSKGLVVGHVQSGKTANFTGVVAKAIDAGYRLVVVLTGTVELLRSQTQRRLDMELVGRENILGGIDPTNSALLENVDYAGFGDRDWAEGRFLSHGGRPKDLGAPDIRRLSSSRWDYRALAAGLSALDFRSGNELVDRTKPLHDPVNVFGADVRIAVVKKNKRVLTRLVDDLKQIHANLGEIPTLIIDDEADQASPNTKDQRKNRSDDVDRSAINAKISELLALLGRAQYVGYTATPFANVFADPDDAEDIFPKDFIVSLDAPDAYMGGRDFHDLDTVEDAERTLATSNELAHVRDLVADPDDTPARTAEMQRALDTFVLTGAVKLWRESRSGRVHRFGHHTMLVHESVKQAEHDELARFIHHTWQRAGYSTPAGGRRLHDLWRDDILPVSRARADGEPVPEDFGELRPHIGTAVDRISAGGAPVVVVNGDKDSDYTQAALDFQAHDVWKILVGGTKLSRGFTVEGLTVTYYRRRTGAADALMQMGRWFGYRPGYRDLVRLFVGRNVPGPRGTTVDLYRTFEAIVRDEEDFRAELRTFQGVRADGTPLVTPAQVPPMVFQSLPWLKPTGTNKMYNAVLTSKGEGGKVKDFFQQPARSVHVNTRHFAAVEPLLDAATAHGTFFDHNGGTYEARYGIVSVDDVRSVLTSFEWNERYDFAPTLQFIDQAHGEGTLEDWAVLVPLLRGRAVAERTVGSHPGLRILERKRRTDREHVFSGSSPRQRRAMEIISGGIDPDADHEDDGLRTALAAYPDAADLHTPTRGALLLTFAADTGRGVKPADLEDPVAPGDVATLFSIALPKRSAPHGRIGFTARVKNGGPIIPRGSAAPTD